MTPYEMQCPGIYKITNTKNGKLYVGSSKNLNERRTNHFRSLRKNRHANILLQNSFNKYGEKFFVFEVLEKCDLGVLLKREGHYARLLNAYDRKFGFNLKEIDENGKTSDSKHHPNYEIINKKHGDCLKNYWDNATPEQRKERGRKSAESRKNNGKPKIIHYCPTCGSPKARRDSRGCKSCFFKFNIRKTRKKTSKEVLDSRVENGYYLKKGYIKPIINGKEYNSPNHAAKTSGISFNVLNRWIKTGKFESGEIQSLAYKKYKNNTEYDIFHCECDDNKNKRIISTRMRPIINGIYFDGVEDAAQYAGVNQGSIRRWINNGIIPENKPWIKSITFTKDDSLRPHFYTPPMPITDIGFLTNPI